MKFQSVTVPLSHGYFAFIDIGDSNKIQSRSWYASRSFGGLYARTKINGRQISMHRFLMNCPSGLEVDHINRNGLDNRRENLRIVTSSQNKANSPGWKNRLSKYKGVSRHKDCKVWNSEIQKDGNRYHLGYFKTEIEAAFARDIAAKILFGKYAYINLGPDQTKTLKVKESKALAALKKIS